MRTGLVLDDTRTVQEVLDILYAQQQVVFTDVGWVLVKDFMGFIGALYDKPLPDIVLFDHDLGGNDFEDINGVLVPKFEGATLEGEKTGSDCASWIIHHCNQLDKPFPQYWVHSQNRSGAENIRSKIESAKRVDYIR